VALPDPVIHLYWAYAVVRAKEMFNVTLFPIGVCGGQAERQYVSLDAGPESFAGKPNNCLL